MPKKVMPKVAANKVVDILGKVAMDLEVTMGYLEKKNVEAAALAIQGSLTRIEGIKDGLELITATTTTNGS